MHPTSLQRFRMSIAANLIRLRKTQALTQIQLAELAGLHVNQVRRYETGAAQPSLDGLKKIALALHVPLDELVFDPHERGPQGDRLTLLFEAVATLPLEEQRVVQAVLDGLIVKHRTRQLAEQHSMPAS
jgi:transcriptional regulator with XRE-family HTH domain